MYFRILHDEAGGSVSYLLADLTAAEAVLIDPRAADLPVLQAMLAEHRLLPRWVLRTHEHDDRLGPAEPAALQALGAPLVQHQVPADALLPFGDEHLQVLATPGHTTHCLSYRWRDRLFCGGLLSVGECPFQPTPALPQALWDSVTSMVFTLPDETLLFGGHARRGRTASTVLEQRRWHPWFGGAGRDEFLARVAAAPARTRNEPTPIPVPSPTP